MANIPPMVIELPMRDIARSILVDLRAYEVGSKLHRNVLAARQAMAPTANFITEQTLRVKPSTGGSVSHTFQGTEGNTLTLLVADKPVRVRLTQNTGVHDLGAQTLLVLTSNVLKLELFNETAEGIDVEIVHA